MSESFIQVAPDSTGKQMRAILRTVGLNNVLDEVIELSDQSGVLITPLAERDLKANASILSGATKLPVLVATDLSGSQQQLSLGNGNELLVGLSPDGGLTEAQITGLALTGTETGLVVRTIPSGTQNIVLPNILASGTLNGVGQVVSLNLATQAHAATVTITYDSSVAGQSISITISHQFAQTSQVI